VVDTWLVSRIGSVEEETLPNRLSLSARAATSLSSSDCVYGRSRLTLSKGSNILARKFLRVLFAPTTVIEEMVVGSVEFWSI
jgi:hypothetical protein